MAAAPAPATPPSVTRADWGAGATAIYFHAHDEQPYGAFSQWSASAFTEELIAGQIDGLSGSEIARTSIVDYGSVEQYVMAAKARLMGDARTYAAILAATDPAAVKALGRAVAPYDEVTWAAARYDVAVRGNMLKFEQNADMRALLLGTGEHKELKEGNATSPKEYKKWIAADEESLAALRDNAPILIDETALGPARSL